MAAPAEVTAALSGAKPANPRGEAQPCACARPREEGPGPSRLAGGGERRRLAARKKGLASPIRQPRGGQAADGTGLPPEPCERRTRRAYACRWPKTRPAAACATRW